jgi:hypothetical protein
MLILGKVLEPLYPKNLELRNGLGGVKVKSFMIIQKAIWCYPPNNSDECATSLHPASTNSRNSFSYSIDLPAFVL